MENSETPLVINPLRLENLPDHILHQIATYSEGKEIWRMMATCRAVRAGVQKALTPYIERLNVPSHPSLFPSCEWPV